MVWLPVMFSQSFSVCVIFPVFCISVALMNMQLHKDQKQRSNVSMLMSQILRMDMNTFYCCIYP